MNSKKVIKTKTPRNPGRLSCLFEKRNMFV